MILPSGVRYRPNRPGLICVSPKDDSLIRVTPDYAVESYTLKQALEDSLSGTWYAWAAKHKLSFPGVAYSVAENSQFVIEVAPDIPAQDLAPGRPALFAGVFDIFTPEAHGLPPAARVCEFQTYGLALMDCGTGVLDLFVAKDGDKVVVPKGCYCALYGLGEPLITVQIGKRSARGGSRRWNDWLNRFGPPLLAYYTDKEVVFELNDLHMNADNHSLGVRLPGRKLDPGDRRIHLPRITRTSLAPYLHGELTGSPVLAGRFREVGIRLHRASPEAVLPPDLDHGVEFETPVYFSGPLSLETASSYSKSRLRDYLGNVGEAASPKAPDVDTDKLRDKISSRMGDMRRYVELSRPERRRLQIVIEGTGAWTTDRYRPALQTLAHDTGNNLSVYYANDENWATPPAWCAHLEPWETYLTKNDGIYLSHGKPSPLNQIDAVFIVTPDVTHAEIAMSWLGKTPVIFVEKPFDSELAKLQDLLAGMARNQVEMRPPTAVVGVDHYLLRLADVFKDRANVVRIVDELGGGIGAIHFEMTEKNLIESGRERTLQLGLGLDLLPHFVAMLLPFGPLDSIDFVQVLRAAQYQPLNGTDGRKLSIFDNETSVSGRFRFTDFAETPAEAAFCAGKGIDPEAKALVLIGVNGKKVRLDMNDNKVYKFDPANGNSIPLLQGTPILSSNKVYVELFESLYNNRPDMLGACLKITDGEQVVRFLDTMWRGVQWIKQGAGINPVPQGMSICHKGVI